MGYNKYSEEFKVKALVVLDMCDGQVAKAARKISEMDMCPVEKLPRSTLSNWDNRREDSPSVSEEVAEVRHEIEKDLADFLEEVVRDTLGSIDRDELKSASLTERNRLAGTLLDKIQLLREKPTEITRQQSDEPSEFFQNVTEQIEENGQSS